MLPANGESGLPLALLSLFLSLRSSQIFHLVLIDLDLSTLLQLAAQIGEKNTEHFLLLVQEKRITDLIFPGLKILLRRFLPVQDREHYTRVAVADGATDVTRFQAKGHGSGARHGTNVRNLAVGLNQVTGLDRCAGLFGGLLKVVTGLGAIGKFLSFLQKQGGDPFVLEFAFYPAANLVEGRGCGRLDRLDLEYCITLRQLRLVRRRLFGLAKYRAHELG